MRLRYRVATPTMKHNTAVKYVDVLFPSINLVELYSKSGTSNKRIIAPIK